VLLLLDLTKITKAATCERRPLCTGDLFSAMAAKVGAIEHYPLLGIQLKKQLRQIEERLSII